MWDWMEKAAELKRRGEPCVIVTVVGVQGSTPREIGARMVVEKEGTFHGTIGGGHLEQLAIQAALQHLSLPEARVERFPLGAKTGQCCGGTVDLMFETHGAAPLLYIFGAGHVGQSLARAMEGTVFAVHLVDEREEWISSPRLSEAVTRHPEGWDVFIDRAVWGLDRVYCAVMTHQHDLDFEIVSALLRKPTRFVGLIGSEAKWRRFQDRLLSRGFSEEDLRRVHCPIGLKTGGKAPAEIAISVSADLLQQHYSRE